MFSSKQERPGKKAMKAGQQQTGNESTGLGFGGGWTRVMVQNEGGRWDRWWVGGWARSAGGGGAAGGASRTVQPRAGRPRYGCSASEVAASLAYTAAAVAGAAAVRSVDSLASCSLKPRLQGVGRWVGGGGGWVVGGGGQGRFRSGGQGVIQLQQSATSVHRPAGRPASCCLSHRQPRRQKPPTADSLGARLACPAHAERFVAFHTQQGTVRQAATHLERDSLAQLRMARCRPCSRSAAV